MNCKTTARIYHHFQFWFFTYDTGNPIPYSAYLLRESLTKAVIEFDPQGKDPALRHMVVMGHSQGGLLTKMTVIDTGDKLWKDISKKPIDELQLKESSRELLEKSLFLKPLPFVRCVIFIATPHRGSFIAGWRPSQWITRFIKLPANILLGVADLLQQNQQELAFASTGRIPTSVDNMTPVESLHQDPCQYTHRAGRLGAFYYCRQRRHAGETRQRWGCGL